jgi:hypothetical protein
MNFVLHFKEFNSTIIIKIEENITDDKLITIEIMFLKLPKQLY